MSETDQANFAAYAPQWWSMAARWLGWRPDEFWRATPTELRGALCEPNTHATAQGPSMEFIVKMMERENNE